MIQPPFATSTPAASGLRQRQCLRIVVHTAPVVSQGRLQQVRCAAASPFQLKGDEVVTVFTAGLVPQHPVEVPPFDGRVMRTFVFREITAAVDGGGSTGDGGLESGSGRPGRRHIWGTVPVVAVR